MDANQIRKLRYTNLVIMPKAVPKFFLTTAGNFSEVIPLVQRVQNLMIQTGGA
jgi:hypothetical protein